MDLKPNPTSSEPKLVAAANGLALVRVTIGAMFVSASSRI